MRGTRFALAARTAGILFIALALTCAAGRDARASTASEVAAAHILLPSAGWNGRPIQAPHRHETVRTATADAPLRGWSAGPVRLGAGFRQPGGSDRVREVQRHLERLGYRVGPVDGLFGRRTRAAVGVVPGQARPAGERAGHARDGATSPGPDRCAGNDTGPRPACRRGPARIRSPPRLVPRPGRRSASSSARVRPSPADARRSPPRVRSIGRSSCCSPSTHCS